MPDIEFFDAPEVEEVAVRMINSHHSRLAEAKIKYLLRPGSWNVKDRERMGNTEKCSSKHKPLTGYDFIVTFNKLFWDKMKQKEREALVDHELCLYHAWEGKSNASV